MNIVICDAFIYLLIGGLDGSKVVLHIKHTHAVW